jgi:hypothetical protein
MMKFPEGLGADVLRALSDLPRNSTGAVHPVRYDQDILAVIVWEVD